MPDEDKLRALLGRGMLVPQGLLCFSRKMGREKDTFWGWFPFQLAGDPLEPPSLSLLALLMGIFYEQEERGINQARPARIPTKPPFQGS